MADASIAAERKSKSIREQLVSFYEHYVDCSAKQFDNAIRHAEKCSAKWWKAGGYWGNNPEFLDISTERTVGIWRLMEDYEERVLERDEMEKSCDKRCDKIIEKCEKQLMKKKEIIDKQEKEIKQLKQKLRELEYADQDSD